jgi:hypothetical protein
MMGVLRVLDLSPASHGDSKLDSKDDNYNVQRLIVSFTIHWNNINIDTLHGINIQYEQLIDPLEDFNNCHYFIFNIDETDVTAIDIQD